jgi:hypothetical protein
VEYEADRPFCDAMTVKRERLRAQKKKRAAERLTKAQDETT